MKSTMSDGRAGRSLHPNADVDCASRRLFERGVSFMPIADDDGRLLGVVTAGDLLEARREG
jgi:CBS domain-containing protein